MNKSKISLLGLEFKDFSRQVTAFAKNLEELQIISTEEKLPINILENDLPKFSKLKNLQLENCKLDTFPKTLPVLTKLECLSLLRNQLTSIPPSILSLQHLTKLILSGNQFSVFPTEILELSSLKILFLNYNSISFIPHEITKLINLEHLAFGFNLLNSIPGKSFSQLRKLHTIFLKCNKIKYLPAEVLKCPIQHLTIEGCPFYNIIENKKLQRGGSLEPLEISKSNITEIAIDTKCFEIPSLKEMVSREIVKSKIQVFNIPKEIHEYLEYGGENECSVCGGPYFEFYIDYLTMIQKKGFEKALPFLYTFCSLKCAFQIVK